MDQHLVAQLDNILIIFRNRRGQEFIGQAPDCGPVSDWRSVSGTDG